MSKEQTERIAARWAFEGKSWASLILWYPRIDQLIARKAYLEALP